MQGACEMYAAAGCAAKYIPRTKRREGRKQKELNLRAVVRARARRITLPLHYLARVVEEAQAEEEVDV